MSYNLYKKVSFDISGIVTKTYSTSFSLAIKVFDRETKEAITSVYGFVRLADEIADSFHGFDKKELMNEIRNDVLKAQKNNISLNPIIHSFHLTADMYKIPSAFIDDFLDSMEMDLTNDHYEGSEYDKYVYGSAEVVGLMCLKIFCNNDEALFDKLSDSARALGSAFQKVNFLRDIKSDMRERGRIYLRNAGDKDMVNDYNKAILEQEVEEEFKTALSGIKQLPYNAKLGVYSAYLYYLLLFRKIRKMKIDKLMSKRVRISNFTKLGVLITSVIKHKLTRVFE